MIPAFTRQTRSHLIVPALCLTLFGAGALRANSNEQDAILQSLRSGKIEQGQKLLKTELQKLPKDVNLRLLEGTFQAQSGQKDKAIETFKKLAADHPTLPEPHNNLGVLYAERNELNLAKASFERALQTWPSYSASHKNLMDLNARLAKQAYARAFRLEDPAKAATPSALIMLSVLGAPSVPEIAPPPQPLVPVAPPPAPAPPTPAPAVPAPTPPAPKPPAKPEPATPATVAPAPSVLPAISAAAVESAAVDKAVKAWASAWSKRDVQQYLDAYAPGFEPANRQSRSSWAKDRRVRIEQRKFIRVTVSRLQISVKDSQAQVKLEQQYESDGLNTSTRKTLELVNTGGRWLIVREKAS